MHENGERVQFVNCEKSFSNCTRKIVIYKIYFLPHYGNVRENFECQVPQTLFAEILT